MVHDELWPSLLLFGLSACTRFVGASQSIVLDAGDGGCVDRAVSSLAAVRRGDQLGSESVWSSEEGWYVTRMTSGELVISMLVPSARGKENAQVADAVQRTSNIARAIGSSCSPGTELVWTCEALTGGGRHRCP